MIELKMEDVKVVTGAMASMSNGVFTVTESSSFVINNLKMLANKVVDNYTGTVLFDGTQNSFCFSGTSYSVTAVQGGHSYIPGAKC